MGSLTEAKLAQMAGKRSFERGLGYTDAVSGIEVGDGWIKAFVRGTERYETELLLGKRGRLSGRCDCPYGQEGNFCKHLVALGLTAISQETDVLRRGELAKGRAQGLDAWLSSLSREELLTLLKQETADDRQLRRRLELKAASARGDLDGIRARIRELLDIGPFAQYGYVEYTDAQAYADQAGQAVTAIKALTESGQPDDAMVLAQETITLLAAVAENIDDSDGSLTQIGADLADAHYDACRHARSDPEKLAHWLVTHTLDDASDLTDIDPLEYKDLLGKRGMASLRRHAVNAWQANPTGWAEKQLMQRLMKSEQDTDTLIAVHAADLAANGHTHLLIARELDTADRPTEALQWAERGIDETEDLATIDTALVDYLTDRYQQAHRPTDALTLRRDHFIARPTLLTYQRLRAAARATGRWPAEREEALKLLRSDTTRKDTHSSHVLVDVLLDDKDIDTAWQVATDSGARDSQWLTLANQSHAIRPGDALTVYHRLIAPLTRQTGDRTYERLISLLLSIRDCHNHLGTPELFTAYAADLRIAQKRKRNLMRLMDDHGL
ncbi:SWIM zinc finger domain-containing protein [Streptomyces sp. NPDC090093]|uniref:SWIM zinc finger family protein n=1 Tax=Streptomyces sp. NPDC090093 TaxID=3365945 RepID=UPI00380AA944